MPLIDNPVSPLTDEHRQALTWFSENAGSTCAWREIAAQADSGNRLATLAKGIYKPAYTDYALSVRQTLTSSYGDKEVIRRPNGSWLYPYFQENSDPKKRDNEATNRGLVKCMNDNIPVGVLIQTKPKPEVEYFVLGLGRVIDWQDGFFIIESYDPRAVEPAKKDAALDRVTAEIYQEEQAPGAGDREWQIRQVLRRRGQTRFRLSLIQAYGGCCAISNCDAVDALEAAHIAPYSRSINNKVSNGLLLRADLHSLFDLGLISIRPADMSLALSPKLASSVYAEFDGRILKTPDKLSDHPDKEALQNHLAWTGII